MEILDINSESRVIFCNIRNDGAHIHMVLIFILKDKDNDTDMKIVETVSFQRNDLQYIKDGYNRLFKHEIDNFGYSSYDKKLCIWTNGDSYHEIDLRSDKAMFHYTFHLQLSEEIIKSTINRLSGPSDIILQNNEVVIDMPSCFSIVFPELIEYVDKDLCLVMIEISTPCFVIKRKFDINLDFIISLKNDIVKFVCGGIHNIDFSTEFIDIFFKYSGDGIEVSGDISDFSSPDMNEIKFTELVHVDTLNLMYKSLCELQNHIEKMER